MAEIAATGWTDVFTGARELHMFRRSATPGGNLFHQWWDGAQWMPGPTEWENIGGELYSDPAVVSAGSGTVDLFAVGPNDNLIHKQWAYGAWYPGPTDWTVTGEKITSTPGVVSETTSVIDLYYAGPGNTLYHKDNGGGFGWRPAVRAGGPVVGRPSVVSPHVNRFDVFFVGEHGNLLHKSWDFGDPAPPGDVYEDLGGDLISDPAVVSWSQGLLEGTPDRIDVFAIGRNRHLLHKYWDGTAWFPEVTGWDSFGGSFRGTPVAVSRGVGLIDVIVGHDQLFHIGYNGPLGSNWSSFHPLFVSVGGDIALTSTGPQRFDVLWVGPGDTVLYKPWDTTGWLDWEDHGGAGL